MEEIRKKNGRMFQISLQELSKRCEQETADH
jgi:hypothetical protein